VNGVPAVGNLSDVGQALGETSSPALRLTSGDPSKNPSDPRYGKGAGVGIVGDPSIPGHPLYGTINGVGHVGTPAEQAWDEQGDSAWEAEQRSLLEYAATQQPGSQGYVRAMHAADPASKEEQPMPESWRGGGR